MDLLKGKEIMAWAFMGNTCIRAIGNRQSVSDYIRLALNKTPVKLKCSV
ncbi:MAG: hypothetical protein LUG49_03220 [Oscillospiraceae bacterium]|nr:hypothetical protein [Oscillospiraceae bacterium]